MNIFWKLLTIQTLVWVAYAQYDFIDISPEPTVFATDALPRDENGTLLPRYIGSVGNGHISTTLYTDTVHMNGLYNGERGESHRARIPSRNNIRVSVEDTTITDHTYGLDCARGFFFEKFSAKNYTIEQRTFAHRYYNRVIVTQIILTATANPDPAGITLLLSSDSGLPSTDINFDPEMPFNSTNSRSAVFQCGQTLIVEDAKYQPAHPTVCVVSTVVPPNISVSVPTSETYTFFTAYDFNLTDAGNDFNAAGAYQDLIGDLFILHTASWSAVWADGLIEVEGNVELSKIIYGCLYYILSSLPVTTTTNLPLRQFYGLSPGGLAYGGWVYDITDYQGHSFWDTETWMYPTILYLYPRAAEQILDYRLAVIAAARDRANETGYKGARYPWEGAVTGREVTPDCCEDTRDMQIHITADISYAVRQYIATTRDLDWLVNIKQGHIASGCTMIREMAEFYTSRADFNTTTRLHDIRGIMPPDEDNRPVDNNPYTNIGAGYAIFFAKYAECLCAGNMTAIPKEWIDLASSLALIYDEANDYHPEFEGYVFGTPIKQADVVLIGFPQQYEMDASTRENDLLIYENVTRHDGPAMTWAMHTIGFLDLNDTVKAAEIFSRSYQNYVRQPYKVWTEAQPPTLGAINFITGMGGFLQSVVSGYGGYRLFSEKIVFKQPRLPPNTTGLRIRGLDYLENIFDLYVTSTTFTLTLQRTSGNFPLVVQNGELTHQFVVLGTSLNFTSAIVREVTMFSNKTTECALPLDKIGTPVIPQTSSTDNPTATMPPLFLTLLIVGLKFRTF